jgi:hypothetical protein
MMKFLISICVLFFILQDATCDASGARHVLLSSHDVKPFAPANDIIVVSSTAPIIQVDPPLVGSSIAVPISGPELTIPPPGGSSVAAPISGPELTIPPPGGSFVAAPISGPELIVLPPIESPTPIFAIPPSTPPPTPVLETPSPTPVSESPPPPPIPEVLPPPPTSTCSCQCVGQGDAECGCSCSVDTNNKFHILFH